MLVVFYISSHGFGHATRQFEIIRHLRQQRPDVRIVIRSTVPRWFLERSVDSAVVLQPCETDTGMVQIDSLRIDESASVLRAAAFYSTFAERVDAEARLLDELGASVVVGDVPPLAFAAAAQSKVPSVAVANFTWDWIYAAYPAFRALAPGVTETIADAYARASLALRLPFHGGFATMQHAVRDVPLVARRSRHGRRDARALLSLDDSRPIVLVSFGGHGAALPLDRMLRQGDMTLIVTEYESAHRDLSKTASGLRCISTEDLSARGLGYEDLVASADVVVTKPGYGIVSECIANNASVLYTSRAYFPENDVLVEGMQHVLRCRFISADDLREGRWQPAIASLLQQAMPANDMDLNGAAVVASMILDCGIDARAGREGVG